jgi:hypothetical protein
VGVRARAPAAREVRARRWRRKPVHAEPGRFRAREALARNRVPAMMPSQWPACWLVLGASRVQLATRKPVEEAAQIPRRVRTSAVEVARIPRRARKRVVEVARIPRRARELAVEVVEIPGRAGELALALEAQDPRRRQVLGRAREL